MKSDTLVRIEGMEALLEKLDLVDAERFITLIRRDPFDYTRWRENLYQGMSVEDISAEAAARRAQRKMREKASAAPRTPKTASSQRKHAEI